MKVAIKDLIELKERITYHSNEYNKIADSKILVARLDNKLYIIDGHARVKKAKDRKEEEIEAEVINANSYEEIVRKHIEINNFRGIIDHIALAIACKEHNLGYIDKTILDKLDIEALRELEKAIRRYEYRVKTEIPILLLEVISKVPLEWQRDFVKVLLKSYKLVKADKVVIVQTLGFVVIADEFIEYRKKQEAEGDTEAILIPASSKQEEVSARSNMSKEEEQEAEGKRVPTPKPEDRESEEEEGKMLKQGDMIEFNTYEELYAFVNTDKDRLPEFAFYKIEKIYESRADLLVDKPSKVRLVVE